jgi:hypothetical protein
MTTVLRPLAASHPAPALSPPAAKRRKRRAPERPWTSPEDGRLAWLVETRQSELMFVETLPDRTSEAYRDRWVRVVKPLRTHGWEAFATQQQSYDEVFALLAQQVRVVAGLADEVHELRRRLEPKKEPTMAPRQVSRTMLDPSLDEGWGLLLESPLASPKSMIARPLLGSPYALPRALGDF